MRLAALLVYPEMPPTYWGMKYALPFIHRKAAFPPLGLMTVAAMLPRDWDIRLVDQNVEPLTEEVLACADLVFVSAMLIQRESMDRLLDRCRALGKTVVAGGPYPTSSFEAIQKVDHFVLDEAEATLPDFLSDYLARKARRVYRSSHKPPLAGSPAPRFDLVRKDHYAAMALQFSRGCPHACEFCDIIARFGRKPRTKPPAQFLGEMQRLYDAGWRGSLFIVDDNFIGNRKEVKLLLAQLIPWQKAHGFPFTLFTEASLLLAEDDDLMGHMVEAGFNMVFLGLETPDAATLASAGKRQNLRSNLLASVKKIQAKGMEVTGGFIVGFDQDRDDIFDRQIRFIQEAGIPTAMVGMLNALPGTPLHRRLKAEGRLTSETGRGNNTHDLGLNFIPAMDAETLTAGYKRILAELYQPDRYFARCLALLDTLNLRPVARRKVRLAELRAFALSLVVQTCSAYGWAYWRFLIRGFFKRPGMMAEMVTMAVKGHHFFKITEHTLKVDQFKRTLDARLKAFEAKVLGATGDLHAHMKDIQIHRDRLVSQATAGCRQLHADTRGHAEAALAAFRASLDDLVARQLVR